MNIYLEYSYNWWLIQCRLHWMSVGNLLACLGLGILFSRDGYTHIYQLQDIATFTIFLSNIPTIGGLSNAMLPTDRQCDLYCNLGHIGSLLATYWHAWTWDYYWQECRRAGARKYGSMPVFWLLNVPEYHSVFTNTYELELWYFLKYKEYLPNTFQLLMAHLIFCLIWC